MLSMLSVILLGECSKWAVLCDIELCAYVYVRYQAIKALKKSKDADTTYIQYTSNGAIKGYTKKYKRKDEDEES